MRSDTSTSRQGREALGWFPALFASLLGAPALLALFQDIFNEHRLVAAFAWIPEGYHLLMDTIGTAIEPPILSALTWLRETTGVSLALTEHWRSILVLLAMYGLAIPRGSNIAAKHRDDDQERSPQIGFVALTVVLSITGAFLCGLRPASANWIDAGLTGVIAGLFLPLPTSPEDSLKGRMGYGVSIGGLASLAGVFPLLTPFAVEVALAAFMGLVGAVVLWSGITRRQEAKLMEDGYLAEEGDALRNIGLILIGGLLTAAGILVANWAMQIVGA